MKKILKLVVVELILIILLGNMSFATENAIVTYNKNEFSISLPKEYNETETNIFSKESGETLIVQTENYSENVIESEIYTEEALQQVINELENSQTTPIKVLFSEINSCSDNNYKAFHINGTVDYGNSITFYIDNYLIYTNKYLVTLQTLSLDNRYFKSIEYTEILDSFKIKDEKLPTEYSKSMLVDNYFSNPILLIMDILLTAFLYCIIPVILRIKNGEYEYENGRKILIINSIVVLFLIMIFQSSQNIEMSSGASAIFYYYINKTILLKEKNKDKNSKQKEEKKIIDVNGKKVKEINLSNENEKEIENTIGNYNIKSEDVKIHSKINCMFCGKELNEYTTSICDVCGKKYDIIKNSTLSESSKQVLIKDIKNLAENELQNVINDTLKEMIKKCPQCNSEISADDKFCTNCGKNLKEPKIEKNYCTNCGKKIEIDWKFCKHCGYDLNEME